MARRMRFLQLDPSQQGSPRVGWRLQGCPRGLQNPSRRQRPPRLVQKHFWLPQQPPSLGALNLHFVGQVWAVAVVVVVSGIVVVGGPSGSALVVGASGLAEVVGTSGSAGSVSVTTQRARTQELPSQQGSPTTLLGLHRSPTSIQVSCACATFASP